VFRIEKDQFEQSRPEFDSVINSLKTEEKPGRLEGSQGDRAEPDPARAAAMLPVMKTAFASVYEAVERGDAASAAGP